ncbi:hypothetical protein, partial [Pedococcus aerophilus]|uniref:hypothetical protein n=1 Tax=Pedococcus aerophilus TaxID=436356 RepID=UPI0031DE2FDC
MRRLIHIRVPILPALLATVLTASVIFAAPAAAEVENNDTMQTASVLAVGVEGDRNAALTPAGDVDWYRFEAPRAGLYTVEVFNVASTIG